MTQVWSVGLDGSASSAAGLRWASDLAQRRNERVRPVAAWTSPHAITALGGRRSTDIDGAGPSASAELYAREAIATLGDVDHVDEPAIVEGHPASVLLEFSETDRPIVVGRRGITALKHRLLGSVSQYLATHAHGTVVVVPETWEPKPLERIVVGFDGSDYAIAALRWALSIAPDDSVVEALIAIDVIPWLSPELVAERHPDAVADAHVRISAAADTADPDERAERRFVLHGPRQALAEALGDADLIVVGPRGIGGFARAMLGSVTTWLLHDARCPIAVVPSAQDTP